MGSTYDHTIDPLPLGVHHNCCRCVKDNKIVPAIADARYRYTNRDGEVRLHREFLCEVHLEDFRTEWGMSQGKS